MSFSETSAALGPPSANFATRLEQFGDAVAVVTEAGERVSYTELAARADTFARTLGPQRRLLLVEAANEIAPLVAYLGALRRGHPVLMGAGDGGAHLQRIIDTYEPDARFRKVDGRWVGECSLRHVQRSLHPDLAVLLSTSGSTGAAKLVRLSHAAVEANAKSIAEYLGLTADERAITTLPIHYSYGLSVVTSHLSVGATILLTERSVIQDEFWEFFEAESATSLAGVPYTYELFDSIDLRRKAPASLRTMTQAGGRLAPETARAYAEWASSVGVRFFVMYGQTEATARMAYVPPELLIEYPGCIGVAIPGGAFHLIDEQGEPVEAAEAPGELVYSGPNVMLGYALNEADLAKGREVPELRTGDLAVRNGEGLYRIVGRKSRFSKLFGLRISLDDVEAALARRGVRAVVTGDDALLAVAITTGDPEVVWESLVDEINLPASAICVVAYAQIPVMSSGKFDYQAILAAAKHRAEARDAPVAGDTISDVFQRAFPRASVGASDSFVSLGGDSLGYVRLSIELEERLGFLPERWEERGVGELEALISGGARRPRRSWSLRTIESELVIRAAAILAVVINHASTLTVGGGAHVLLMLSGYNLSRYQRTHLIEGDGGRVLVSFLQRIILPYYVILVTYLAIKQELDLPSLLLVSNFVGRSGTLLEPYWFLEALLQCMIVVVALFQLGPVRRAAQRDPWAFGLTALAGAIAIRVGATMIFHHDGLLERTPDSVGYMLVFGWCLHQATTTRRKLILTVLVAAIAGLQLVGPADVWSRLVYPANLSQALWFAVSAGLILWVPRLLLPEAAHAGIGAIAMASFYIYLTHGVPVHILVWGMGVSNLAIIMPVSVGLGLCTYWAVEALTRASANWKT